MYWNWLMVGEMRTWQKHENMSLITAFVIIHQGTLNLTTDNNLLAVYVYVGYRNQRPDENTEKHVLKELQKNNIDVKKLLDWNPDDCQQAQTSTESVTSA